MFGDADSDEDLDAIDGTPDVEGEDDADPNKLVAGGAAPVKKEEKSQKEYDKFTSWFTKFAEKNGAKRRRYWL